MAGASAPGIWLHATEPALLPALAVLADQLAERPDCPQVQITGDASAPGPGD